MVGQYLPQTNEKYYSTQCDLFSQNFVDLNTPRGVGVIIRPFPLFQCLALHCTDGLDSNSARQRQTFPCEPIANSVTEVDTHAGTHTAVVVPFSVSTKKIEAFCDEACRSKTLVSVTIIQQGQLYQGTLLFWHNLQ